MGTRALVIATIRSYFSATDTAAVYVIQAPCLYNYIYIHVHVYTCMYVYMSSGGYLHIFPKLYCYMYMYVITFKELHIIYYIDMSCTLYICTCMQGKALLYLRVNYAVHALYIHTPVPGQLCGYQLNNLPSGILIHM